MRKIKLPTDAPGLLAAVGVFLFKKSYRRHLAEGLGISRDTLWWWLRGSVKPHHDIEGMLVDLLDAERDASAARGMEITAVRKRLLARRPPAC